MGKDIDESARIEAQKAWNGLACGELEGNKDNLDYFRSVEKDRYAQQPWMHEYFKFEQFKDKEILEIGIGQGTDMMQFAQSGANCHGVDITENHIKLTLKNAELRGYKVNLNYANDLYSKLRTMAFLN